jgi:excisionase family DNA binding protein
MSDPTDNSDYLKIGDAARFLGVNKRTVYRRVWSGELPASKVGGLYFIRREDLKALLAQGKFSPAEEPLPDAALLKCGYCFRLLDDSQIGQACQAEGCNEVICAQCLSEGVHYCARHSPTREERWQAAQAAFQRGELGLLVKGSAARLREVNFASRIQQRLSRINTLVHPLSGEVISIPDWDACLEAGDERAEVLRLLGRVVMDDVLITQTPLNLWLNYRLPQPKGKTGFPLEVQVRVLSHLPEILRDGFDTRPFTVEELTAWLVRLSDEAQRGRLARLVVLASTTGWDSQARAILQGQAGSKTALPYAHRLARFYLFDLEQGDLVYNLQDDQARLYAELFIPTLLSEELAEAAAAVEKELVAYDSLTLEYASQVLPFTNAKLKLAFERLATTGRYHLAQSPESGLTIIRN